MLGCVFICCLKAHRVYRGGIQSFALIARKIPTNVDYDRILSRRMRMRQVKGLISGDDGVDWVLCKPVKDVAATLQPYLQPRVPVLGSVFASKKGLPD